MSKEQKLFDLNMMMINVGGKIKMLSNYIFHHSLYTLVKRNKELYHTENRQKLCYVCALGPSLKKVDLNRIKGDTLVVNRFFKIGAEYPFFVPTYYLILDHLFNSPENLEDFEKALTSYLDKGTIFILNSKLASLSMMKKYQSYSNIYYISSFNGSLNPKKKYSINGIMPSFQNVVGASIFFLMQMGYKNISLLGCDFNSFASRIKSHCYSEKNDTRSMSLAFELFCYSIASRNHDDIQAYAIRHGVTIKNSTIGSLIDSYSYEIEKDIYY